MLLVDDNNLILCSLKALLQKFDVFVITAKTGREALDLLANVVVDLVLLDYNLPDMDGIQVLKTIKSKYPFARVIMLSDCTDISIMTTAFNNGIEYFLHKPITEEALTNHIFKIYHNNIEDNL